MLAAKLTGIAAPKPGVEQDVVGQPLARAERPLLLEGIALGPRPSVMVISPGAGRFHALRRVD